MFDSLQLEMQSDDVIYSHGFFNRILQAVNDGADFILELQFDHGGKPVWFCWRVWEKVGMDSTTLKWIKYTRTIERDYNKDAIKK